MNDKDQLRTWVAGLVKEALGEMAISNYKTVGDFSKRSSFTSQVDRDLVTHPKAIEKIKRQWQKTPYDFDIFVVNDKRANKPEFREVGVVDPSFIYQNMKLTPEEITLDPSHITIIFTNNVAAEKTPLTGWTMAHRLGHAFAASRGQDVGKEWQRFTARLRELFNEIMKQVYNLNTQALPYYDRNATSRPDPEKMLKHIAQTMGTMKAARDNNLRSWPEFAYELLAQYLITGKITLNPLPDSMVTGMGGFARPQTAYVRDRETQAMYNNHDLGYYMEELHQMIDNVLDMAVGKVLVM